MKLLKASAPMLAALLLVGCHSGGAEWEPVVIDMSVTKTPTPASATATAGPSPTATPSLAPRPAATPTPSPVPTAPAPIASPATIPPPPPAAASAPAPERVAASRIDAFNRRDLEALAGLYASDAQVFDPPDRLRDSGRDQIRQTYARRFSSAPRAHLSAAERMTEGNFVVERETESSAEERPRSAIVISEVREGKIVRLWILR